SAGGDPLGERRRVEVDVQRVPVCRHPARDVHSDRGDLPWRPREPQSRESVDALACQAECLECFDESLLEVAAVLAHVAAMSVEGEDRVAEQTPGTTVSRTPAR